jgi:hypothetical protein
VVNKLKEAYAILLAKLKEQQNDFIEIERRISKTQNYKQAVEL